jgi:hypothetical protein
MRPPWHAQHEVCSARSISPPERQAIVGSEFDGRTEFTAFSIQGVLEPMRIGA